MGAFWHRDERAGDLTDGSSGCGCSPVGRAPAVSVMMDVGDDAGFLDEALDSLSRQTFHDFEIVLAHVGKAEGTRRIIRRWCLREPRLRAFETSFLPLAQAHNFVARQARGTFLARLDADDAALPDRLELQHRALQANPAIGIIGGAAEMIDASGKRLCLARYHLADQDIRAAMARSCPFVHSAVMIRADAFWAAGGYRTGLNLSEDYDLYARLIEHCEAANLPTTLIRYRVHSGSLTSSRHDRMAIANFCVGAARLARASGREEPFSRGTVSLRRAQRLTGLSRTQMRHKLRAHSLRLLISRRMLLLPLPARVKSAVRSIALGLGGRGLYVALLGLIAALPPIAATKGTIALAEARRIGG